MTIRQNYEIGDLVIVDSRTKPVYGRIVGRYFNRSGSIFDIQPEETRDLKDRLSAVEEHRITKANGEVARMVRLYEQAVQSYTGPKHIRDEV
ncbi:hypothetical protein P12x_005289 [Tundrisphaera lichenicola]|uniref:hypothetical protein n=1 Tax=Tundrisphaera lichenicola TaxID=2029860 RepID=UPI003EB6BE99